MIKGLVFDLDDTLLKTQQTKFQVFKETGRRYYDLKITNDLLSTHWGLPFRELVLNVFGDVDDLDRVVERYLKTVLEFHNEAYEDDPAFSCRNFCNIGIMQCERTNIEDTANPIQ